jgi:hypothetical protein
MAITVGFVKGKDGADGKDGVNGADGKDGKDGVNGSDGKDGLSFLSGTGVPDNSLGKDGDTYLDVSAETLTFFKKESGVWS